MSDPIITAPNPTHRDRRPDLTRTPPLKGSGRLLERVDRSDALACLIMLVAMTASSAGVLWSSSGDGYLRPPGFVWLAGISWFLFIVGLFAIWEQRFRKGLSRDLFAIGAAVLAVGGFIYLDKVSLTRLLLGAWMPAVLAMIAAFTAAQAKSSSRPNAPLPS